MNLGYTLCLLGLMATLPPPLQAAEPSCARGPLAIEADAPVRSRWPGLIESVREALRSRADIDACAKIRLSARADEVDVEVMLPDGRLAARSAARSEDVLPTLQALLLIPETATPPEPAPPPIEARAPVVTEERRSDRTPASLASEPVASSGLGIEFSIATGARLGDGQIGVGLGALSFLDMSGWLLGFEGRADQYHGLSTGPAASALELGLLLGRRVRFGYLALDLTLGPALALLGGGMSSSVGPAPTTPANRPPPAAADEAGLTPRVIACARLNFNARSVFRTFVAVEGVLDPTRIAAADPPRPFMRLPTWSVGLALGMTLGTR